MVRADEVLKEITRLESEVQLLDKLRVLFYSMECDGERERAWNYLKSRFAEFEQADMPSFIEVEYAIRESK